MSATNDQMTERDNIEDLLPWYAAGTLGRKESERVEQALASDPELARRFELVRDEFAETILLNETLGAPSKRAMEKLFAAIDAEPARKKSVSFDLGGRLAGLFLFFSARTLAYAGVGAALLLVIESGVIGTMLVKEQGASYETAAAPETAAPDKGSFVMVRFNPQATAADISKFLSERNAVIVDGPRPTSSGLYKVRVAVAVLPKEQLATILKEMQSNTIVSTVLPAQSAE
jgi:anti-sigma factor RsiW